MAIRTRRELRRVNRIMGSYRWISRVLSRELDGRGPHGAVELGAGDGGLADYLVKRPPHQTFSISALDLAPRPDGWPEGWRWIQGDMFETLASNLQPTVLATLILHHFQDEQLRELGGLLEGCERIVVAEPARAWLHRVEAYGMIALGMNPVTRADAHTSIRAGFRRGEMPALLGLDPERWEIIESHTFMGALRLFARKRVC